MVQWKRSRVLGEQVPGWCSLPRAQNGSKRHESSSRAAAKDRQALAVDESGRVDRVVSKEERSFAAALDDGLND